MLRWAGLDWMSPSSVGDHHWKGDQHKLNHLVHRYREDPFWAWH